jgi:hypothetical protein
MRWILWTITTAITTTAVMSWLEPALEGLGHNTSVPRQAPTTFQLGRIRTRPHRAHGQMNASELDDPDAAVMRVLYHEHAALCCARPCG